MADSFTSRLVAAVRQMQNPPLDSKNPHFGIRFSSLLAVSNVVRPVLGEWCLAYRQTVAEKDGHHSVVTWVYGEDADGTLAEKVLAAVPITVVADPQKMGSAITYAKRYCLLAAFGLVGDEDDDGNAASAPAPKRASKPKAAPKAATPPKPSKRIPTAEEAAELNEIAKALGGDKRPVNAAYQANGMEGARALVEINPSQVELFDSDQTF